MDQEKEEEVSTTTTTTTKNKKRKTSSSSSSSSSSSPTDTKKSKNEGPYSTKYVNKQRCLVLCSRGAVASYRHLMGDIRALLPHHKKDVKLDTKRDLTAINEIAEMKSCNTALFFEFRKRKDLYLWASATPFGPSVKFLVQNVHTMEELRLTGNCLKGSRPILSFDTAFDKEPHLKVLKELFTSIFGTPLGHPKSKPFVDHVLNFSILDGRIWFRNYQIVESDLNEKQLANDVKKGVVTNKLVEIGPRFVLQPIRIFSGSFTGETLYMNEEYISPNLARAAEHKRKGGVYASRVEQKELRKVRQETITMEKDEVDDVFR